MIVMLDQPSIEAGPPRSLACKPSAFEPWMRKVAEEDVVLVSMETVRRRKSPTNHGLLVEVDPE
jgi:hypothetical protein